MLSAMTSNPGSAPANRRGVLVAEIVLLVLANAVDTVLLARLHIATGPAAALLISIVPAVGPAASVLAVLRRRFPDRVALLGSVVAALSLVSTGASLAEAALGQGRHGYPGSAEVLALALLAGAGCRRLAPRVAAGIALLAGLAMVAAPVLRYGIGSPAALLGVPAALVWGAAVALGLILRDADRQRRAQLTEVRTGERLRLARELHDLVAYHVSGIVVQAQAAQVIAGNPAARQQDPVELYAVIEEAGTAALTATRRLVGMLRTNEPVALLPGTRLGAAMRHAIAEQGVVTPGAEVTERLPDELDELPAAPVLAVTAHRVVLEALTNVRRHAEQATEIVVAAHADGAELVLTVDNDGVTGRSTAGSGYGLVGMTERVSALGGTLRAGPAEGHRWHLTARLPLTPPEED